jgi:hypothetical protein
VGVVVRWSQVHKHLRGRPSQLGAEAFRFGVSVQCAVSLAPEFIRAAPEPGCAIASSIATPWRFEMTVVPFHLDQGSSEPTPDLAALSPA